MIGNPPYKKEVTDSAAILTSSLLAQSLLEYL